MKAVTTILFTIFALILTHSNCAKLPPDFKKCDTRRSGFEKCLGKAINSAIEELYRPIHDYNLPSLSIVRMPDLVIEFGDSAEGFSNKLSNFSFYGLTRPQATRASMDFATNTLKIETNFPTAEIDADYEGHGLVVLLPLDVWTEVHVCFVKPTFKLVFKLEEYGAATKFYKVVETDLAIISENVVFEFKDLFGNKTLNDAFNAKMTKHGAEINKRFTPQQQSFAPYFGREFNNLLAEVPIHELFDGIYHY